MIRSLMTRSMSPDTLRLVAAALLSAALGLVAWRVLLEPRAVRLAEKRETLSTLDRLVRDRGRARTRAAMLEAALREREARLAQERTRSVSLLTPAAWLEVVDDLARVHTIHLHGFTPMPGRSGAGRDSRSDNGPSSGPGQLPNDSGSEDRDTAAAPGAHTVSASWQVALDFEGAYHSVRRFLDALEEDERVEVVELTLSVAAREQGQSRLRASCLVSRMALPSGGLS